MSMGGGVAPSKMGAVKTAAPSKDGVAMKGKTKGTQIKMAGSGGMKKGGKVKKMKNGGTVSSASKRADGIAVKGKTKGRFV